MVVQHIILFLVAFSFFNSLGTQSTSDPLILKDTFELESDGKHGKCTTKLTSCKIKRGDLDFLTKSGAKGEKGDKGDLGDIGPVGPMGAQGEYGLIGPMGPKGITGDRGEQGLIGLKGDQGDQGYEGPMGDRGLNGLPGPKGNQGVQGLPGLEGETGFPGRTGPPGAPGKSGVCSCINPDMDDYPKTEFDETNMSSNTTCKWLSVTSGTYNFSLSKPFEAYCNMSTQMTCLNGKDLLINDTDSSGYMKISLNYYLNSAIKDHLWLSQIKKFDLQDIYGIDRDQISWLQKQSTSATQTLRIFVKNLRNNYKIGGDYTHNIHLLTWNEQVIGPYPTRETPFFYSLDKDACLLSTRKSEWCSIDIVLVSEGNNRLPIIDVRLDEISLDFDDIYVKHVELCFG